MKKTLKAYQLIILPTEKTEPVFKNHVSIKVINYFKKLMY